MKIEITLTDEEFDRLFELFKATVDDDFDPDAVDASLEIDPDEEDSDEDFADLCECPQIEMDDDPAFSVTDIARLGDKRVVCSLALYRDYGEERLSFSVTDCDSSGEVLYRVQAERHEFKNVIEENLFAPCALDLYETLTDCMPEDYD